MNERLSSKRQQAELAFAKIVSSPAQNRAHTEQQIMAAERQARTSQLRELRLSAGLYDECGRAAAV
jgi:hypothetical protein